MLRLSSSNLDAHGEIGRRDVFWYARKPNSLLGETFQFLGANVARFQVLTDLNALCNARSAGYSIVEVTRQFGSYCIALHWTPLPVELARWSMLSEESATRRAAENASPK